MQSTANLWLLLCQELEDRRRAESAGEQISAVRTFEDAVRKAFPANSPRLQEALEISGDIFQANGASDDALRAFRDALGLARGSQAPGTVARLATKLAVLSEGVLDPKTTMRFYVTAIEAMEQSGDRSQVPTLLNNLAALHRQSGDFTAAEHSYRRALAEAQRVHGPNHPEAALIANNLGVALTEEGRFDQAEDMHMLALAIRERNFGGIHPEVAQSLANLATVFHGRHKFDQAEGYYRAALDTLAKFRHPSDPDMAEIQANYNNLPQIRSRNLVRTRRITP